MKDEHDQALRLEILRAVLARQNIDQQDVITCCEDAYRWVKYGQSPEDLE